MSAMLFPSFRNRESKKTKPTATEVLPHLDFQVRIMRKPRRNRLTLTVKLNGRIQLIAPYRASEREIEIFVEKQAEWIQRQLSAMKALREKYPQKLMFEGEPFPFLGDELVLRFAPTKRKRPFFDFVQAEGEFAEIVGWIPQDEWEDFVPDDAHPQPWLWQALRKFYADAGRRLLEDRVAFWAPQMGVLPTAITVRSQRSRWGSCSPTGAISLNWRLMVAPLEVIDYVVIHELAHLKHHNHSKRFWGFVAEHCPRYLELRRWLRDQQYEADFLSVRSELY